MHLSVKPDQKIDIHLLNVNDRSWHGTGDSNVQFRNEGSGRRPGK
jgi:hypothetical protein